MRISSETIGYLAPRSRSFWRWADGGIVEWCDGRTIVYADELRQVFDHFATIGLPFLDGILLVFAASRESWQRFGADATHDRLLADYLAEVLSDHAARSAVTAALDELNQRFASKHGPKDERVWLAFTLLSNLSKRCSSSEAADIGTLLQDGLSLGHMFTGGQASWWDGEVGSRDFANLVENIKRLSPERLDAIQSTSVEEPTVALQTVGSSAELVRDLLQGMLLDAELSGLSTVATQLMGVLYREPKLLARDDDASGGLSDITNRGSFDRLLLSELAYDDDMLAVRVANNEALYLRREPPKMLDRIDRRILIENGVRMWGLPRLFATSVALAMTAISNPAAEVHVWRSEANQLTASDLTSRTGIHEHLGALDRTLHLGSVLKEFLNQQVHAVSDHEGRQTEDILVLSTDSWNDADFRSLLAFEKPSALLIITVDRQGGLQIVDYSQSGFRIVKQANLDLSRLFPSTPTQAIKRISKLPVLFDRQPFPLRLKHRCANPTIVSDSELVCLMDAERLVFWNQIDWGAMQIRQLNGAEKILWAGRQFDSRSFWVIWKQRENPNPRMLEIDSLTGEVQHEIQLAPSLVTPIGYRIEASVLVVYGKHNSIAHSLVDGTVIASLSHDQRIAGDVNVFRNNDGKWKCIRFDQGALSVFPIEFAAAQSDRAVIAHCFQWCAAGGFIGFTKTGMPYVTAPHIKVPPRLALNLGLLRKVHDLNGDGSSFWFELKSNQDQKPAAQRDYLCHRFVIDAGGLQTPTESHQNWVPKMASGGWVAQPYSKSFSGVGYWHGKLILFKPNSVFTLDLTRRDWVWRTESRSKTYSSLSFERFESVSDHDFRFGISKAKLGGVELFLDDRGFLHLRSCDGGIPELCLVLKPGKLNGCTSNDLFFGDRAHCGSHRLVPHESIQWDRYIGLFSCAQTASGISG
jgi:hypothetical protein